MVRKNRPSPIPASPLMPQPTVDLDNGVLTARLPSGDSVTVYLYGATVTSWKTSNGQEQLWLSTASALDGSKPIRGGVPLVFPNFGPPDKEHTTGQLPQHGLARSAHWEFLGKSSSESTSDDSVKLDFGLGPQQLDESIRSKWNYGFGLVYSVTLTKGKLQLSLLVKNEGTSSFEFHALFHTYLAVKDISKTTVSGLGNARYRDKTRDGQYFDDTEQQLAVTSETDRVYTLPLTSSAGQDTAVVVKEAGQPTFTVTRDALPNVVVWNAWEEKAKAMADFKPDDGYKHYICIEPGSVLNWTKLEGGDAWTGSATFEAKL